MRPEYLSDIDGLASPVLNIPEEMDVEMWAQEDRAEGKNNEEEFQEDNDKGEDDGKAEEERWPFLQDLLNEYNPFTVQSNWFSEEKTFSMMNFDENSQRSCTWGVTIHEYLGEHQS